MDASIELRIVQTATGVQVTGPIQNKAVCYAMLEVARDIIKDAADAAAKSPIVRGDPAILSPTPRHGVGS